MLSNEVVEALFLEGFKRGRCHYYSLFFTFYLALYLLCPRRSRFTRQLFSKDLCLKTDLSRFADLCVHPNLT